jgi:hypothetical protein
MSTSDYKEKLSVSAPKTPEVADCRVIAKKDDLNQPLWGQLRSFNSPERGSLVRERCALYSFPHLSSRVREERWGKHQIS